MDSFFSGKCFSCEIPSEFEKFDIKKFCKNQGPQLGFSFMMFFFSFRQVNVFFGKKKMAKVGSCLTCGKIQIQCPYCMSIEIFHKKELCSVCKKKYYLCK